ncbi:MAG TPA: nuclear transport factor 2 family protein [Acidimicrobiales bacterium]
MDRLVTLQGIDAQEKRFADAFASLDIRLASDLYHPEVVYLSPTTRLFGEPRAIEGVEATLDFIQMIIAGCRNIEYRLDERAVIPGATAAYTRIMFDWDADKGPRLRSEYVVVYRYRDGLIARQELYYDPSAPPGRV